MGKFSDKFYDILTYPLEAGILKERREKIISSASGHVLEIGSGTGANFKFYDYQNIDSLTITDLDTSVSVKNYKFPANTKVEFVLGNAEELPFEDNTFDSVVFTLLFCMVKNPLKGLEEVRRVLKPEGKIYFIEHVSPDNKKFKKVVDKVNPTWSKMANGCNINRNTFYFIKKAGFEMESFSKSDSGLFIDGIGAKKPIS